jgi:hypothetical protein
MPSTPVKMGEKCAGKVKKVRGKAIIPAVAKLAGQKAPLIINS